MFYSDKPISFEQDDLLGRSNFSKTLAHSLANLKIEDTFTIGIFGSWGSGKTSVVNMAMDELEHMQKVLTEKERMVIMHFEPWNFSDTDQLLSQFFIQLSSEFRSKSDKTLIKIGEALVTYSDAFSFAKLIPEVGNLVSILSKAGINKVGRKLQKGADEKDISKQKNNVIKLLQEQNHRILVVIDDIDRLSNEQIRLIFQLITSVAKFPNTAYLLVFDKDIVTKALEEVQEGNGEEYLQKIIQMPIQIPDIQKNELRKIVFNRFDALIQAHNEIIFAKKHWDRLYHSCVDPFISNLRDVNRICNSLEFKLTTLASEIEFTDLVAITVLEIKCPQIYEWIKKNKHILTGSSPDDIYKIDFTTRSQKEYYEEYKEQLRVVLFEQNTSVANEKNLDLIITVLSRLFPIFGNKIGQIYETADLDYFRRNNLIAHWEKFDRYFSLNIDSISLKRATILSASKTLSKEKFIELLLEQDNLESGYIFLEEVKAMIPELSIERVKVIANAIIFASNMLHSVNSKGMFTLGTSEFANYMVPDLLEHMPADERYSFAKENILCATSSTLGTLADIINTFELWYGRLEAKGVRQSSKEIITLNELITLENDFLLRAKELLKENVLFDLYNWKMVYHLIDNFDESYTNDYMCDVLTDNSNVLKYIDISIGAWIGGNTRYEIRGDYKKYLTEERVLEAIQCQKETGDIFLLPEGPRNKAIAFYLKSKEVVCYDGSVSQEDVDSELQKWIQEAYMNGN